MPRKIIKLRDRIKKILKTQNHGFYNHNERDSFKRELDMSRARMNLNLLTG